MADPKSPRGEGKRFRVIDVKPEEVPQGTAGAHSAWAANDRWPGSAAPADMESRMGGRAGHMPTIVVTTTTVVRFVDPDDGSELPSGGGAWLAADVWPGSDAPKGNQQGRGRSSWVAADVWPGSDAPKGNRASTNADSASSTDTPSPAPVKKAPVKKK